VRHLRVVADTSTVISGLLWHGAPRQVLDAARAGTLELHTSASLVAELADVLQRPKFARRLALAEVTPQTLVVGYALLARLIVPAPIGPVVEADPDDDAVLACAAAARAEAIVSGDRHLLELGAYEGIPILSAAQLLARLAP
jgi:putative PIN family toxin of toxin-antitoxin system